MVAKIPKLSVVCPAYEEEDCLPFFHQELDKVLAGLETEFDVEILYVDDGSRDRTLAVLKELLRRDQRVRYLSLSRNFGHQIALSAGLEHARGDVVITMDSDLQHPPAVIPQLLAKWREGFDIVLTVRQEDRRLSLGKRLTSRLFYRVMAGLSDTDIRPAGSDFRLMTRKAVAALVQLREKHRFLRGMVQWLGFPKAEIAFQPDARKAGQSKYTWRRMLNLASDGLFSFSRVPLRVSLYAGFLSMAVAALMSAIAGIRWLASDHFEVSGWACVLISVYFLGGCLLWAVGVLGEYIGRIHEQVKERPLYLLKDHSPDYAAGLSASSSRVPFTGPNRDAA